jgi:hypothetical protein
MANFTFFINGHEYTSNPANTTAPDGYRFIKYGYLSALGNLAQDIVAIATQILGWSNTASNAASTATTLANSAASSATTAGSYVADAAWQVSLATTQVTLATAQKSLAMDWATKISGTVDGTYYGARYYAIQAAAYAESLNMPLISGSADAGKPVKVNGAGTAYELGSASTLCKSLFFSGM